MSIQNNIGKISDLIKHPIALFEIVLVLLSAIFEAMGDVLPKHFVGSMDFSSVDPVILTIIVYLTNTVFFTIIQKNKEWFVISKEKICKKNPFLILVIIGFIDCLSTIFFFWGLKMTNAINGTILGNTEILFGIVLSIIILRESINKKEYIPILIILFGTVLIPIIVSNNPDSEKINPDDFMYGSISIVISSVIMATGVILYQNASQKISSRKIIQASSFFGFALMLFIALVLRIDFSNIYLDASGIITIVILSIVGFGLPAIFFLGGLKTIGSIKTIVIFSSTSAFALLFSNIFLLEQVMIANLISVSLIILGSIMLRKRLVD